MVIKYAKSQGLKTINVVRREEQKEELKALGYALTASTTFLTVHGS